jgi:hypothetical protein
MTHARKSGHFESLSVLYSPKGEDFYIDTDETGQAQLKESRKSGHFESLSVLYSQ